MTRFFIRKLTFSYPYPVKNFYRGALCDIIFNLNKKIIVTLITNVTFIYKIIHLAIKNYKIFSVTITRLKKTNKKTLETRVTVHKKLYVYKYIRVEIYFKNHEKSMTYEITHC